MQLLKIKNNLPQKIFLFFSAIIIIIVLSELFLRIGNILFISNKNLENKTEKDGLIIFSGDSWTYGSDASSERNFFSLLKQDEDLSHFTLVNLGYGGNNGFQIVNSVIKYPKLLCAVIINLGINGWHLIGLEEFTDIAKEYLTVAEMRELADNFKVNYWQRLGKKLKIYKLFCYLLNRNKSASIDIKMFNDKLGSNLFWDTLFDFREKYPDYDKMLEVLPCFIKNAEEFNLDQKFYFVATNLGFDIEKIEKVLKESGIFYPARLKIISYNAYKELDIRKKSIADTNELIIKWSLKVLNEWAKRNEVLVFVQTYPDIKKKNLGENAFDIINNKIKLYAVLNKMEIIDHNENNIDWEKYRTCWHINDAGHKLMKDNIKFCLFENSRSLIKTNFLSSVKYEEESAYH